MQKNDKIYVAGHNGMVGSALVRKLRASGYDNLLLKTREELDLCDGAAVAALFAQEKPSYVMLAAAKVGGIKANNIYRADFLMENLLIETSVIKAAHNAKVKKLLFLGSSCIYPKNAPQPMPEECLLSSALEPTNEPYAIAKIAGLKLCEAYRAQYRDDFISAMPANLYGPGDNFHLENAHVLPALLRKTHEAKRTNAPSVEIWGAGAALREFLHVDDLAAACLFLMESPSGRDWTNIGSGEEISIGRLAELIQETVGYKGALQFNSAYPDGTPRKLLDSSVIKRQGWTPERSLQVGLRDTYRWFVEHESNFRR